jgi:L-asparagine oxygenase
MNALPAVAAEVPTVQLSERSRLRLFKELFVLNTPYIDLEDYLVRMHRARSLLPLNLIQRVRDFKCDAQHPSVLLVRNLPVDPFMPDTPKNGERAADKVTFISEGCLLALGLLLGEPFAYWAEKGGSVIHNIVPIKGSEQRASNEGSEVDFGYHTELAYFAFRPDYLLLYCLRPDHRSTAITPTADVAAAFSHLTEAQRVELRRPVFRIKAPQSFARLHGDAWSEPRPIVFGTESLPEACVNLNGTEALTAAAEAALDAFRQALGRPDVERRVCLQPGECLLIDNRKALHGRRPFAPRYDGNDRWLQRIYITTDLWPGRLAESTSRRVF